MSAKLSNKEENSNSNDSIPFTNKIKDNKTLNQLLYYVYDDDFVLMINELSTSILNYHKSINKYFSNIRILLNKMGESSYLTAIEGNCSHLENSFKKFYSNAKLVFRRMKLYRNEKLKNINESTSSSVSKNNENKSGLTIIINNNNNNNSNLNNDKIIGGFSRSPKLKNSPNFITRFNKNEILNEESDMSTDKISAGINQERSNYILEKKIFNFFESMSHLLRNENNEKLISSKINDDLYFNKNYVINKKNNTKIEFLEYIDNNEKKIFTKVKYLISSKNKVFNDIESLIETSQKEKKDFNNQINVLKVKLEKATNDSKNANKKLSEKNAKLLEEIESMKKTYEDDLSSFNDKINDIEKQIQAKESELNKEISKNKEILEKNNNLSKILKEKKDEIIVLEVENNNLNDKLDLKTKECNEYKQKYKNEIKLREDLIASTNNNKDDIEKYKSEINDLKKGNKDLINEIKEKNDKIDELNKKNNNIKKEYEEEINNLKEDNKDLIKENKNKDKEIVILSNNKKEINMKLKNIINEYEEEIRNTNEKNKNILQEKDVLYNELNKKYNDMNKKYIDINKKYNEINDKYDNVNDKYKDIINRNSDINDKNNLLNEKYKEANKKYNDIYEKYNETNENYNELNKEYNELNKKYKENYKNLNDITQKYNNINSKYIELNDKYNETNKKYKEANKKYNEINEKYISLNKKYEDTRDHVVELQMEKDKYKKEEIIRKEEYDSIREKYISLIESKSKENKIYEKNKNRILELEKEINKKNGKLLERQKEIDKNQEDIINFQNEVNQLQNEIKELEEEIDKLNNKINTQNDLIKEYKEIIDNDKSKNTENEKEIYKKIDNKSNKPENMRDCYVKINSARTKSAKKIDKKKYVQNDYHYNYNSESVINKKEVTNTINTNLNESKNIEEDQIEESKKIDESTNIENAKNITDINALNNTELEFTPENYKIIKCTEVTSKLRWYLFKRRVPVNSNSSSNSNAFIFTHLKSYFKNSKSYKNSLNNYTSKNPELYNASYEDFIWKPFKNQKEFIKFGELPISESRESWNKIEELNGKIRKLEQKMIEKEKEYEVLYINYNILNQKNKNYEEQDKLIEMIDKLKKENANLNNVIIKLKTEKNDDVGLSFIDNDLEGSKFLDDKCFDDIFTSLDKKENDKKNEISEIDGNKKNNNNMNKSNDKKNENKDKDKSNIKINKVKESLFNSHLKDSINLLMNQASFNQNAKSTLSSILIQLGCSDEDIYKLMGNYRGTISIAGSSNYNLIKKY